MGPDTALAHKRGEWEDESTKDTETGQNMTILAVEFTGCLLKTRESFQYFNIVVE